MPLRRSCLVLSAALLAALLGASPAAAQISEGAAAKALKKRHKQVLKDLKGGLKAAADNLGVAMRTFEQAVQANGYTTAELRTLFVALDSYQLVADDEIRDAENDAANRLQTTLNELAVPAPVPDPLMGMYPRGLYYGSDGALGRFQASARSTRDKSYAGLRKKLARMAAALEKRSGVGLTFQLEPPRGARSYGTANAGNSVITFNHPGWLGIDLVLAASRVSDSSDGVICMAGTRGDPSSSPAPVNILIQKIDSSVAKSVPIHTGTGRWVTCAGVTVDEIDEGNFVLRVDQGDVTEAVYALIGVR